MWPVTGFVDRNIFLQIGSPEEVLYEFEIPRIFVMKHESGQRYLFYQCGEDEKHFRFLFVPCSPKIAEYLRSGECDLRTALWRSTMWLCDVDQNWNVVATWVVSPQDLPAKSIPSAGVMLLPNIAEKSHHRVRSKESSGIFRFGSPLHNIRPTERNKGDILGCRISRNKPQESTFFVGTDMCEESAVLPAFEGNRLKLKRLDTANDAPTSMIGSVYLGLKKKQT